MEEHGCELQLEHLEQFFLENKEPLEEIVKEFEQNYPETRELFFNSESQACPKFQNWMPSNQDEWGGGFPVNLKPLTQNDMEHFLRATHACQGKEDFNDKQQLHNVLHENNQIEDNFDNESLADSCLFFSNDGNKIFTCSFPEFASPRGSVLGRISHYDAVAPPHYEETPQFDKESNFIKDEPPQFPQEISLSSNVMRGNFKPRYPEPSVHYASGLSDVAMQELTRNQNQLAPPQFIDNNFFSKQNVLPEKDVSSLYSSLTQEGSRKRTRPPSPYGQTKQQQHVQPFSDDSNNHRNDDTKESFVNVRSSALPKHTINKVCTLSPPTFSSDTNLTLGTSSRESNSPGKSSITSPEQLDDFEQRSNVEWTPFKSKSWCKLFGADRKEVRFSKVQLNVDKGFNYSHMDDSFVCQRKNHFQVTFSFCLSNQPKFIEMENSLTPLSTTHLHFYGIKAESESHVVSIEQSESDRSKHHYQPFQINLNEIRPNIPVKVLVGRLHFGETTLNNMRKRGKPNPDQRYFKLVVNLGFSVPEGVNLNNTVEPHYTLLAYVSEKIIVRASNPNQFENDPESLWIKGKSGDSICHYGNVGINTKSPTEAMTVHGSVKITGQLLEPSDARIKTEIKEVSTKEQLQNINMINMYQYRYLPSYEEYAGLKNSHKYVDGSSPTDVPKVGILAQQVSHILPDAVQVVGEVVLPDGRILEGFLVVNKDRIFMEGIGAVKELSKVTQSLERRIDKIELNNKELTKFNKSIGKSVFSPKNKTKSNPSNTKVTGKAEKSKMSKKSNLSKAEMQSLPGQSGQEKLSSLLATLFRKRWKTIALATAISVALICSIIGMALGIKSTKNPTEPGRNPPPTNFTTTSKRPNATTSRPECTQNLSCVPSVSSFYSCPSVCGKGDTNEGATVTLAYIGDLCQSTTTDAPSTAAPNPNDIEYSSVAHDDNTVVQYSVAHDDGTASDNGSQNKSYSNQPLFVTTPHTTFVTLGNGSTNSTRTKRGLKVMKRDAIFNTSLLITQIRLPEFNISLCTDTNLNFSLSKTFPQIDVLIQFSLVDGKDIALCGWKSTQWFGNNETHSPCFKEKTKEVYTWKLPIGHYKDLVFNFLVFNEKDAKDSCQKIADAQLGRSYSISFSRKCQ